MRGERRGWEEEIEEQEGGETDQAGKINYLIRKIIKGKNKTPRRYNFKYLCIKHKGTQVCKKKNREKNHILS